MECESCLRIFEKLGNALNSSLDTRELLNLVARGLVEQFRLMGCHIRLLSRDRRVLEGVASFGLSETFLGKGPVDAERSVAAALEGRTVAVLDCARDPRIQYREACAREGIVSMLTVPLRSRGQVIGVLRLSSSEPREFTAQEIQILEVVSSFVASTIIHSMFHGILDRVTEAVHASTDLETLLRNIVGIVSDELRAKGCSIRLLDPAKGRLRTVVADGLSSSYLEGTADHPGEAIHAALQGMCVPVLNAKLDPRVPSNDLAEKEGIGSILFAPLVVKDQALGVLGLYTNDCYQFSQDELELMRAVADHCALAIRNAQMYASIRRQYETLTEDFQQWFEHVHAQAGPPESPGH